MVLSNCSFILSACFSSDHHDHHLKNTNSQEVETELLQDLRDRWELLAEFMGHEVDDVLIAHLLKHHCDTEISATQESPEEAQNDTEDTDTCPQRWAILRTSDFHNQVRYYVENMILVTLKRPLSSVAIVFHNVNSR